MTDAMKLFLALLMVSVAAAIPAEFYTSKYDDVDIGEVLKNDRLYHKYYKCLASTGPCTPDGKELKDILAEAIKTDCSKCSEKQKNKNFKFLKKIMDEKPDDFTNLEKIYDPEQIFRKKHAS